MSGQWTSRIFGVPTSFDVGTYTSVDDRKRCKVPDPTLKPSFLAYGTKQTTVVRLDSIPLIPKQWKPSDGDGGTL